jgi:hypothetical protein
VADGARRPRLSRAPRLSLRERGKRIIYTDFRDCASEAEMAAIFNVSRAFLSMLKTRGVAYQHKVKAKAVLGVTGIKRTFINTYSVLTGIDSRAFATEAEAIAYLVSKG